MDGVRCKFRCSEVSVTDGWGDNPFIYSYKLNAVYYDKGNAENKKYWEATPSGSFEMNCTGAKDLFIPGKDYYIDITPAQELPKELEEPKESSK